MNPSSRPAAEHERLLEAVAALTAECQGVTGRVAALAEQAQSLSEQIQREAARSKENEVRLAALAAGGNGVALSYALLEKLVASRHLSLRQDVLEVYFARLSEKTSPDTVQAHRLHLEKTGYARLLTRLFSEELLYTVAVEPRTLREFSSFNRGTADMARAARAGVSVRDQAGAKITLAHKLLMTLLSDDDFDEPPTRVCEIGGAWGATITHLKKRYDIATYQNYEIDPAYARWAEKHLGAINMPVDGETLAGTDDGSMDLAIANNSLFFMPSIKVWSYLCEMSRVVRPGGLVVFNALLAEGLDAARLDGLLAEYFPRRSFAFVPEHFLRLAFPPEQFALVRKTADLGNPNVPYFVFKRLAGRKAATARAKRAARGAS